MNGGRPVCLEDGSLLALVGDVSAKSLDAAMLGAAILCSLANETHCSPASPLACLNRGAMGLFITACRARCYLDGGVVPASAGQISPNIEGSEVQRASGLPLGMSRGKRVTPRRSSPTER
jgi:hypothetical protein